MAELDTQPNINDIGGFLQGEAPPLSSFQTPPEDLSGPRGHVGPIWTLPYDPKDEDTKTFLERFGSPLRPTPQRMMSRVEGEHGFMGLLAAHIRHDTPLGSWAMSLQQEDAAKFDNGDSFSAEVELGMTGDNMDLVSRWNIPNDVVTKLLSSKSRMSFELTLSRYLREERDRATQGNFGFAANLAAGLLSSPLDPITYLPIGAVFVKGAKLTKSAVGISGRSYFKHVGRGVLTGSVVAGTGAGLSESLITDSQISRSGAESLRNTGFGAVLGGVFGGVGAAIGGARHTRVYKDIAAEVKAATNKTPLTNKRQPGDVTRHDFIFNSKMASEDVVSLANRNRSLFDDLDVGGADIAAAKALDDFRTGAEGLSLELSSQELSGLMKHLFGVTGGNASKQKKLAIAAKLFPQVEARLLKEIDDVNAAKVRDFKTSDIVTVLDQINKLEKLPTDMKVKIEQLKHFLLTGKEKKLSSIHLNDLEAGMEMKIGDKFYEVDILKDGTRVLNEVDGNGKIVQRGVYNTKYADTGEVPKGPRNKSHNRASDEERAVMDRENRIQQLEDSKHRDTSEPDPALESTESATRRVEIDKLSKEVDEFKDGNAYAGDDYVATPLERRRHRDNKKRLEKLRDEQDAADARPLTVEQEAHNQRVQNEIDSLRAEARADQRVADLDDPAGARARDRAERIQSLKDARVPFRDEAFVKAELKRKAARESRIDELAKELRKRKAQTPSAKRKQLEREIKELEASRHPKLADKDILWINRQIADKKAELSGVNVAARDNLRAKRKEIMAEVSLLKKRNKEMREDTRDGMSDVHESLIADNKQKLDELKGKLDEIEVDLKKADKSAKPPISKEEIARQKGMKDELDSLRAERAQEAKDAKKPLSKQDKAHNKAIDAEIKKIESEGQRDHTQLHPDDPRNPKPAGPKATTTRVGPDLLEQIDIDADTLNWRRGRHYNDAGEQVVVQIDGPKWMAKLGGIASPLVAMLSSSSTIARSVVEKMYDSTTHLAQQRAGIPTSRSVQSYVARKMAKLDLAMGLINPLFKKAAKKEPGLKMDDFMMRAGRQMVMGQVDDLGEVGGAVKQFQRIYKEIKEEMEFLGMPTIDDYYHRVYHSKKVNTPEFVHDLTEHFIKKGEDADSAKAQAIKSRDNILSLPEGFNPDLMVERGANKSRTLQDLPPEILSKYIDMNAQTTMRHYLRSMSGDIELTRAFGDPRMKKAIQDVEFQFRDLIEAEPSAAGKKKLAKEAAEAISTIEKFRDDMRGLFNVPENPDGFYHRFLSTVRKTSYMAQGGSFLLSNIVDMTHSVGTFGLRHVMKEGWGLMYRDMEAYQGRAKEGMQTGEGLEAMRAMILTDMHDTQHGVGSVSKLERAIDKGSEAMGKFSGLRWWADTMQRFNGVVTHSFILQRSKALLDGTISKTDEFKLAGLNIGKREAQLLMAEEGNFKTTEGGNVIADTNMWANPEAVDIFRSSISKSGNMNRSLSGIGDKPFLASTNIGRTVTQYMSFAFAAVNRITISRMQARDAAALHGSLAAMALGGMIYSLKQGIKGKPLPNIEEFTIAAIDHSGLTGYMFQGDQMLQRLSGNNLGLNKIYDGFEHRYYTPQDTLEAVLGPSGGFLGDLTSGMTGTMRGLVGDGTIDPASVQEIRNTIPFQNLFYLQGLFTLMEN